MVIDFYDLKTLFGPLVNDLDHSLMVGPEGICLFDGNGKSYDYMQERIRVMNFRPTTENLAVWIAERLEGFVDKFNADRDDDYPYLKLEKIQLFETATGWVTVEL
jgi:6-pyruvoyl-tetrahydropterin synthase